MSNDKGNGTGTRNGLSRLQSRRVEDFVHSRRESFERGLTCADAARAAAAHLGIPVTPANIQAAAGVMGVPLNGRGRRVDTIAVVAKALVGVMSRLGEEVPEELAEIARKNETGA